MDEEGYHRPGYWERRYADTLCAPPDADRGPLFDWLTDFDALVRPSLLSWSAHGPMPSALIAHVRVGLHPHRDRGCAPFARG